MCFSGISLVFLPSINRILCIYGIHIVVAIGFGKNGGGSDREVFAISFYYRHMRCVVIRFETVSVHDNMLWSHFKLIQCSMHGEERGIQDIYLVYFFSTHYAHCPCHSLFLDDRSQLIALMLSELLRVV